MSDFIIDEMIIRECDSLKDPQGNHTIRSLDFITSFIQSSHRLGINKKIVRKLREYQDEIKNTGIYSNPMLSALINDMMTSNKIIERDGTPGNYNPIRIKKCDREFVGVSIHLNGIFVTNDQPLIDNIRSQNLQSQFTTVNINDAKNKL
jgi:hypothetical protein